MRVEVVWAAKRNEERVVIEVREIRGENVEEVGKVEEVW